MGGNAPRRKLGCVLTKKSRGCPNGGMLVVVILGWEAELPTLRLLGN
jgi:hypothetical protein